MSRTTQSIAVLACLATLAGSGVATAATNGNSQQTGTHKATSSSTATMKSTKGGTHTPPHRANGSTTASMEAYPADGPGKGREARCNAWTKKFEATQAQEETDGANGNEDAVANDEDTLADQADSALDDGCVVIY
jgi:hypothetical protein